MAIPWIYFLVAIVSLVFFALALIFLSLRKKDNILSPLAVLGFAFLISGIVFGEDQIVGYGLLGTGVLLAIADILVKALRK